MTEEVGRREGKGVRVLRAILPDSDTLKFLMGMILGFFLALWAWGSLSGVRDQFVVLDSRLVELRRELDALSPRLTELERLLRESQQQRSDDQDAVPGGR